MVIAIVLGAIGYWSYRSQMALYAMFVAFIPFFLALSSLITVYLFSQFDRTFCSGFNYFFTV